MQDATRTLRCVAILERLAGFELLRLWPVALQIARLIATFRREEPSAAGMYRFETQLNALLRELGRLIVQWVLNRLEPEEPQKMPPLFRWEGDDYRRKRKSPLRNLNCMFGPIKLRRYLYQPVDDWGRCLFPLELQLGIVAGVATPALADTVARLAADLTQRQVLGVLRLRHGVRWGAQTLRKVTAAVAEAMSPHRHAAQVQKLLGWLAQAEASSGPRRPVLSAGRDGCMMPILKSQKYKEGAAATVSVLDRRGRRLGTVYLGQMPESGQGQLTAALTQLLIEVLTCWVGALPRLTYVTDCGHHQTEYFEQVLSKMMNPRRPHERLPWEWIVDYYHACLYITKLAEAIFGPGRAAFAWAAKQRRVLKDKPGGVFRVLRSAGALLTIRGLVGSHEAYWEAYRYLRERASKMDYRTYRHLRLPIGSGVTEAACKIVFTQRFKQSGMKWNIVDGQVILSLRVIALSGIWDYVREVTLRSYLQPIPLTPIHSATPTIHIPRKIAA
jgi:hypothetical protein